LIALGELLFKFLSLSALSLKFRCLASFCFDTFPALGFRFGSKPLALCSGRVDCWRSGNL